MEKSSLVSSYLSLNGVVAKPQVTSLAEQNGDTAVEALLIVTAVGVIRLSRCPWLRKIRLTPSLEPLSNLDLIRKPNSHHRQIMNTPDTILGFRLVKHELPKGILALVIGEDPRTREPKILQVIKEAETTNPEPANK